MEAMLLVFSSVAFQLEFKLRV